MAFCWCNFPYPKAALEVQVFGAMLVSGLRDTINLRHLFAFMNVHCELTEELNEKLLASKYATATFFDEDGRDLLSWAAQYGNVRLVTALLELDALPAHRSDNLGRTPLSWAADMGHETIVGLILAKDHSGADYADNSGKTPLSWAALCGHHEVVKMLLAEDYVDHNSKDNDGGTPLTGATRRGHEVTNRLLLTDYGDRAGLDDMPDRMLLDSVTIGEHPGVMMNSLAAKDSDTTLVDGTRMESPLSTLNNVHKSYGHFLLAFGRAKNYPQDPRSKSIQYVGIMQLLLDVDHYGPGSHDVNTYTPSSAARATRSTEVIQLLFDHDYVYPYFLNNEGCIPSAWAKGNTPMEFARFLRGAGYLLPVLGDQTDKIRMIKLVQRLLRESRSYSASQDNQDHPTLVWAARRGQVSAIEFSFENDQTRLEEQRDFRDSGLLWAVRHQQELLVEVLLEMNAPLDSRDENGRTPLSWAAQKGYVNIVRRLLRETGLQVDAHDHSSRTPLSWAAEHGHGRIVWLLLDTGRVDPDSKDRLGRTPLLQAAKSGHALIVRMLLDTGLVDPNIQLDNLRTPLSYAAARGHTNVVHTLCAHSCIDIDLTDDEGLDPIQWAWLNGHVEIVRELSSSSGTGAGFLQLQQCLTRVLSASCHVLSVHVEWELPDALAEYPDRVQFWSILTVSGSPADSQVLLCGTYMKQTFEMGETILQCLEAAWATREKSFAREENGFYTTVQISGPSSEFLSVSFGGEAHVVCDMATAVAWFCCALRPTISGSFDFSTFRFLFSNDQLILKLMPLRRVVVGDRCRLHNLFSQAVIVEEPPLPKSKLSSE